MKIKWSGLGVTDGSGKIGGNVAAKNRYGNYLRRKGQTIDPATAAQVAIRAAFSFLSSLWRTLDSAARESWNALASSGDVSVTDQFGDAIRLSGFNMFKRFNANLQQIGLPAITSAPLMEAGASDISLSTADASYAVGDEEVTGVELDITNAAGNDGLLVAIISATPGVSAGKSEGSVKNLYRQIPIGAIEIAPGATQSLITDPATNLNQPFQEVHGIPAVGSKIFWKVEVVNANSGQRWLVAKFDTIVIA